MGLFFFWLELFKILSVMLKLLNSSLLCLSFEERGQIVLHLSITRSVDRPSDVRSIFLDPLLESGQTWYGGGCLLRVDDHSYFVATWSKVKVLWPVFEKNVVRSMSFDTFDRKSPNSVQWMPLESFPYWYSDHMAKCQGQTSKFCLLKILWFKLWIKGKLSTAHHRNASQNIVVYFAIKLSRS